MSDPQATANSPFLDPTWTEIRDGVRAVCAKFPNAYWVKLDHEAAYPTEFVAALTRGGIPRRADPRRIWRLRPAALGRRRDPRDHPRDRMQCRRLPRADVYDGHRSAPWLARAEAEVSAADRLGAAATAGVRRHRADYRLRYDATQDPRGEEGQRSIRRQRAEGLDEPRAAIRPDAAAGADDAGRQGCKEKRRVVGLPGRFRRRREVGRGRDKADRRDDQPQYLRGVHRQSRSPRRKSRRRGGQRASTTSSPA